MGWKSYLLWPEPDSDGNGALLVCHACNAPSLSAPLCRGEGIIEPVWQTWKRCTLEFKKWGMAISLKVCETRLELSTREITQIQCAGWVPSFVPATTARKGLLAARQTLNKQRSSVNQLRNPSLGDQWYEITFHSLSREAKDLMMSLCHKIPVSDID